MRRPITLLLCLAIALPAANAGTFERAAARPAATASVTSSANELADLRAAERRRADAVANRDVDAMRELISGQYYHVETNGRTRTKSELLQLLARDEYEFSSYAVDDAEIRLLDNGRAAVVSGRFVARMRGLERPREFRGRYVRLWTLQADGWRNALHQSTEIRPSSSR